jgi:peptide/nickel transport system permease protein
MINWKKFFRSRVTQIAFLLVVIVSVVAIAAPLLAPYEPNEQFFDGLTLEGMPLPPNSSYWLGTDLLGRDLLSRLMYGARTSLLIGIIANAIAVGIGAFLGIIAGYSGGVLGSVIMRFTDLMMAFPALLLAIALAAIFAPSIWIVALVIALVNWVWVARVIYAQTVTLKNSEFVQAVKSLGASWPRILLIHITPHLIPTIMVWATLGISTTVLLEATLSFLGIGVRPPTPSWGGIIFESQSYFLDAPWLVFFPGAAILSVALSFNLLGDALRDFLDPTQRGRN